MAAPWMNDHSLPEPLRRRTPLGVTGTGARATNGNGELHQDQDEQINIAGGRTVLEKLTLDTRVKEEELKSKLAELERELAAERARYIEAQNAKYEVEIARTEAMKAKTEAENAKIEAESAKRALAAQKAQIAQAESAITEAESAKAEAESAKNEAENAKRELLEAYKKTKNDLNRTVKDLQKAERAVMEAQQEGKDASSQLKEAREEHRNEVMRLLGKLHQLQANPKAAINAQEIQMTARVWPVEVKTEMVDWGAKEKREEDIGWQLLQNKYRAWPPITKKYMWRMYRLMNKVLGFHEARQWLAHFDEEVFEWDDWVQVLEALDEAASEASLGG